MLGLEDLAHATRADLAEQHIVAQDERRVAAREKLCGLELIEPVSTQ